MKKKKFFFLIQGQNNIARNIKQMTYKQTLKSPPSDISINFIDFQNW